MVHPGGRRVHAYCAMARAPIPAVAVAGFATWQRTFDPYWFLPLLPSFVLTVVLGMTAVPARRVISGVSGAILVLVLLIQPQRFERANGR